MAEPRKGRQTPTQSVVLPYFETKGPDAIDAYNQSGRTAQEWQELLMADILAVNEDGLWTHTKFGYEVPRRNGKNEIAAIREYFGLLRLNDPPKMVCRSTLEKVEMEEIFYMILTI